MTNGSPSAIQVRACWPRSVRGSCGEGGLTPADPNKACKRNVMRPSATRLSAMPLTTWSARKRSESNAWSAATNAPPSAPPRRPSHAEPVQMANAAAKKAPKDIAATIKVLNAGARQIVAILEANDFDIAKAAATAEFVKLSDDPNLTAKGDELDTYLNDKCGIAPDSSQVGVLARCAWQVHTLAGARAVDSN